ncbi:MAG: DUF4864 domain-containing protein [Oscillatoriales cyanobacterium RU_3_3]|nr:DUF4864 domain-containing protein [Oscillatoriales cyanobacterium RU_3_3]NJR21025.1 DUF4864 domain-containing protein [Richelia sp. CSU_2_1]NJS41864.1 DUF4864 domain-containing protein [Candidatus Gracilibacteria bacterium]
MQITETDRTSIRSIVEQQLLAFQRDDAAAAFAFASPGIQQQFRKAESFMKMVKIAYQAVYRPRSVLFEDLANISGNPAQPVFLLDPKGIPSMAVYLMEKQPDRSWRINGCYLVPISEE